jgi:hypothetical protein
MWERERAERKAQAGRGGWQPSQPDNE